MIESPYVRVVSDTEPVPSPPDKPALSTGFEPDRFQKFAIEAIEAGENVLVTAKTGSGKTFVGEYQIAKSLQRGGRIFYTTPVKSLSNQKFNDLKKLFPESSVGIMTGDIKFRPDAQIIVMTTEILRNLLFKKGTATESVGTTALISLTGLDSVIFDEVHYINDVDRGHVWEECLILLPPAVKLILLSATLSSPFGFAKWLGESKKVRVWLISTLWRAVPLQHCVLSGSAEGGGEGSNQKIIYDSKETFHADVYSRWLAERDGALLAHDKFKDKVKALKAAGHEGSVGGKTRPKSFEHDMNACLGSLHEKAGLPAIVFVFSRTGCEKLADKVEHNFLDSSDSAAVAHIWNFHLSRYSDTLEKSSQAHKLRELAMKGIAFHHSGLLPFLKEILEILFSRGLIKVLFATETFAVGINMPTKTVIFTALEKYTDGSIRLLKSAEYIQMAGRAGRRGKDDRGLVIYLPQRDPVTVTEMKQIMCGKAATFGSRMNFHYDFLLKIMNTNGTSKEQCAEVVTEQSLVQNSYWWALEHEAYLSVQKEADYLSQQIAEISLTAEQYAECQKKADIQRRISETQNAKRKAAQRELLIWEDAHRVNLWEPILERFSKKATLQQELLAVQAQCELSKEMLWSSNKGCNLPNVVLRKRVLEEYGYVKDGQLTSRGLLASEVNEGHPFMMTELFLELRRNLKPADSAPGLTKQELLTVLAVFLGEPREDVVTKSPDSLDVSKAVSETLWFLSDVAKECSSLEGKIGVPYEKGFWELSTEWVEPVSEWLEGDISLPEIAVKYEIFEGNMMKALMKLSGLLDEFQSMAALMGELEWLAELQEARQLILRDIVIAESLYLRI
jgi:superfamily II RNA helicase